jgi:hypothetical protein
MGKERPLPDSEPPSDAVRLHITPLTAFTAPSLIPPSILDPKKLSTITYHTIEAFPEKSYGYIDLPKDQAERLKKRLKGALFRGVKVCVEEAREESWKRAEEAASEERRQRKRTKREKRKKQEGVLEGTQLPQDRRIARGWAEKEKKDRKECLFRAAIPANKVESLPTEKAPGEKAARMERREKRKRCLVKEFENTQKFPTFLKTSQLDPNRRGVDLVGEYTDGVGWVDGRGCVVETKKEKRRKSEPVKEAISPEPEAADEMDVDEQDVVDFALEDEVSEAQVEAPGLTAKAKAVYHSSSESEEDSPQPSTETAEERAVASGVSFSGESSSEDESEEEVAAESPAPEAQSSSTKPTLPKLNIHPLEVLYKPTVLAAGDAEKAADAGTFKFGFGEMESSDDDEPLHLVSTPHRNDPNRYRSGAPTPDTAIGSKRFFSPAATPVIPLPASGNDAPLLFMHEESRFLKGLSLWQGLPVPKVLQKAESEEEDMGMAERWKKVFYENRGEWNREWKRKRKEGLKAKRRGGRTVERA